MSFACFFRQWNHHESLLGCRESVPDVGIVLEHHFVFFVIHDHSQSPQFIDAEEWTGIVPGSINQVHVYGFT